MIRDTCALHEHVASQLRTLIIMGEFKPGERLIEERIATRLGVSRNPVREAIRSLEESGLVDVKPNRGASVCVVDPSEVHHIQELRILLEGYAAQQAAIRQHSESILQIEHCLRAGRKAVTDGDLMSTASFHRDFHRAVERASGVPLLARMLNPLWQRTGLVFALVADKRGLEIWDEHDAIHEAISAGDAERAKELSRVHVLRGLESFDEHLEASPDVAFC